MSQNVSQREPKTEPESARESMCEPEWGRENQRVRQRKPESALQGLKVSLRVTLGTNGARASQGSLSLKALLFLTFFYNSCQK